MHYHLNDGSVVFNFSRDNAPALKVPSGAEVEVETKDCFSDQLQTPEDTLESIDWDRVNPATGPIFVEGAQPGDALAVTIKSISVAGQGVMAVGKDMGTLGNRLESLTSKLMPIRNGFVEFAPNLEIPLRPMIGVIGVAPAEGKINCGTPGSHGGNMDNTMIGVGATLYLPVFVEGALFALGDVHAVMGDGEIGVTGVEVRARVSLKLEVKKGIRLVNPVLENEDSFITIASAPTLDEAVSRATGDMADILLPRLKLPLPELIMLMSAVGHTQICQVVDPLRTARFVMPKWILEKYDFTF